MTTADPSTTDASLAAPPGAPSSSFIPPPPSAVLPPESSTHTGGAGAHDAVAKGGVSGAEMAGGTRAVGASEAPEAGTAPRVVCRVRPAKRVLIPPPAFGMVEDGLYRCGQPSELNFAFMETLKLKSVVWLAPEDPTPQFLRFLEEHNIRLFHLGADDYAATYDPLGEETVLQALNLVLDPAHSPLAVMCNMGRHRTGTCIGVLRKLQRWNLASILEEYRRYAGPKVRVVNEQFIELFDVDLASSPNFRSPGL